MNTHIRIAYIGDSGVRESIEGVDERLMFVPVEPDELSSTEGIDCVLCVGSLPEALKESEHSTLVMTDENEIIEGLLVLAREGTAVGETRPVIVGTVAEEAWSTVETGGATLMIGDDRTVHVDRSRLRQLFENAFRNSVEHRSTGSRSAARSGDSVEHGLTCSQNAPHSGDSVEHGSTSNQKFPISDDTRGSKTPACQPESSGNSGDSIEHGSTGNAEVSVEATTDGFRIDDDGPGVPEGERKGLLETAFGATDSGFGIPIIRTIAEGHGWEVPSRKTIPEDCGSRSRRTRTERINPRGRDKRV